MPNRFLDWVSCLRKLAKSGTIPNRIRIRDIGKCHSQSKKFAASSSAEGLFQFRYMPFGLKTAAAVFTKLMRKAPMGIPNVEHNIYDIWIATKTWAEHTYTLRQFFGKLR